MTAPGGRATGFGPSARLLWLVPAGAALLLGLNAGLLLLGVPAPLTTDRLPQVHGMLMVLGFVGTLVALERATAWGRWQGFLAPALLGLGGILLVASPVPLPVGKAVLALGAGAFALLYVPLWRRQYDATVLTQLLGAGLGCAAAVLWMGDPSMERVVPWLIAFLVLTIAAERVELARISLPATAGNWLLGHGVAMALALTAGLFWPDAGAVALGVTLLALGGWLVVHDVARRTIRGSSVTRYMAACILAGYVWLMVAGVLLLWGQPMGQPAYDAVVHAVFLGYTFSMIMAHAPSILPAVLRVHLPYRAAFWAPVALLQVALVVRLGVGDGLDLNWGWKVGGVLGVVALLLFAVTALTSALLAARASRTPRAPRSAHAARGMRTGGAVGGLLAVVLVAAVAAAVNPTLGKDAPASNPDAPVMTVHVEAADMHFTPAVIEVPVGTRLVVELANTDASQVHDLVFANGVGSQRLAPGGTQTLDVGVITGNLDGWCSVVGHRQMGMTLTVAAVEGDTSAAPGEGDGTGGAAPGEGGIGHDGHVPAPGSGIDLTAAPGPGFTPADAVLPPLPPSTGPTTHRVTLTVEDTQVEVAPGVTQTLWTYNGTAPGPVLHGRVGDTFEVTLVNSASMGHSVDFHAGSLAPNEPMRTIAPGESLTYTFTASRAGIWMYHCSTMPMTAHIANGMYGAVVIEPQGLPAVDRSYVVVQGEYYLGDHAGGEVDTAKIAAREPDLVVFNGYANQYVFSPLSASVGERVRVWVLDAGIERATSFHVVGGQFDVVWAEGAYLLGGAGGGAPADGMAGGSQALALSPAQGGFVELVFPEAGTYPFVSHYMIDAEAGAQGRFEVGAAR